MRGRHLLLVGVVSLILLSGCGKSSASSHNQKTPSVPTTSATSPYPKAGMHWTAAISFTVCGTKVPDLPPDTEPMYGITTPGLGIIDIGSAITAESGANATLKTFSDEYPGFTLTARTLHFPDTLPSGHWGTLSSGSTCPPGTPDAGQVGVIKLRSWTPYTQPGAAASSPEHLRLANGQLIQVAFVPKSATPPYPSRLIGPLLAAMPN